MTELRCNECKRRVAARWRKCPFCHFSTGVPWHGRYPAIDRQLSGYRALAIGSVMGLVVLTVFLSLESTVAAVIAAVASAVYLTLALASPLSVRAWRASLVSWPLLAVVSALLVGARPAAAFAGLIALPAVWMLKSNRAVVERLEGREPTGAGPKSEVPRWSPCINCGSRESEVVAPLFCVSLVAVTLRFPGAFVSRCERHAKLAALPAIAFSACLGLWGIPWGPIWTFDVLMRNMNDGGVTIGSDLLRELERVEAAEGGLEHISLLVDFVFGLLLGLVPLLLIGLLGPWHL